MSDYISDQLRAEAAAIRAFATAGPTLAQLAARGGLSVGWSPKVLAEGERSARDAAAEQPRRETLPQQLARLHPEGAPAGLVPVRLVPVQVFGAHCQCHEDRLLTDDGPECGDFGYGIRDAVSAYSDCNRAIGRIYRRDEDESPRAVGDAILVWVTPEQAALFDVVFGEP